MIVIIIQVYKTFHAAVAQSGGAGGSDPSAGKQHLGSNPTKDGFLGGNPSRGALSYLN